MMMMMKIRGIENQLNRLKEGQMAGPPVWSLSAVSGLDAGNQGDVMMAQTQNIDVLRTTGQISKVPLTRNEILAHLVQMLNSAKYRTAPFRGVSRVEWAPSWYIRMKSTNGTIFKPIVEELNRMGIETKPTIGSVMDVLSLSRTAVHDLVCMCIGGHHGCHYAYRLEQVAKYTV
jgi:hypothetical protein